MCKITINNDGTIVVATETTLREDVLDAGKGETEWETRAARKIRKKLRNRTPKNTNKSHNTSLISSQKESLDRNHGAEMCTTALPA